MINLNRRRFIGSAAGLVALGVLGAPAITGRARLRVMVIGGGPGGVAAATEIRSTVPDAQILLVEADPTRLAWPQSGSFISGRRDAGDFATLASVGVDVSIDEIRHIDWQLGVAEALSGRQMGFDRVVMAPGIAFRDEGISGYDAEAAALFPHAWTGRSGIAALAADITAMDRNGWVIIRVPEGGMRYPLGPYRRAGEIAAFLETENPGARVILLDHSQAHPAKQALLKQLQSRFGTMIDHVDSWLGKVYKRVTSKRSKVATNAALSFTTASSIKT